MRQCTTASKDDKWTWTRGKEGEDIRHKLGEFTEAGVTNK